MNVNVFFLPQPYSIGITVALLVGVVIYLLFVLTLYKAIRLVPKDLRLFPAWFCWFFIIPLLNTVTDFLMLPFGLPISFKRYLKDNSEGVRKANQLMIVGWLNMILALLLLIFLELSYCFDNRGFFSDRFCISVITLGGFVSIFLKIIYWIQIHILKKRFLEGRHR